VGTNVEGVVARVEEADGGAGHLWKLVRSFDDPATWTEPHVRHVAADGPGGVVYRHQPLPDEWELYDLDADPVEATNLVGDPDHAELLAHLRARLGAERARCVPERNEPWPYVRMAAPGGPPRRSPRPPVRAARRLLGRLGMHPEDPAPVRYEVAGGRALVVATNHGVLDVGKPTGVFASELTVPYYAFRDAGMVVDVASPRGGTIPVDPLSLKPALRTEADDRFLVDEEARAAVTDSLPVAAVDVASYDLVYLAGGWGAAFDFATSDELAAALTEAAAADLVIGGICHGPLGLCRATGPDGRPLVAGRRISAVTDKQVTELGIGSTPFHPETELRRAGATFESTTGRRDVLANHWVVDGNLVTGQNQNAGPMVAREMLRLVAERRSAHAARTHEDPPALAG
jgi:putative intracellular protease/amidase